MIGVVCLKYVSRKHSGRNKVKGHTLMLHTSTIKDSSYKVSITIHLKRMTLPCINILYLTIFEISPDKIVKVKVSMEWSHHDLTMTIHTYTPKSCPNQVQTLNTLWYLRYSTDKIYKGNVTTARLKVKSWSSHDTAHLQSTTNEPIGYQPPTV